MRIWDRIIQGVDCGFGPLPANTEALQLDLLSIHLASKPKPIQPETGEHVSITYCAPILRTILIGYPNVTSHAN